MTHKQLYLH